MSARPEVELEFGHNGEKLLRMIRRQNPDYHPIMSLLRIAQQAEDGIEERTRNGETYIRPNLDVAMKCHATVLRYVEPELRAVEISTVDKDRRTIEVSLFREITEELTDRTEAQRLVGKILDAELMPEESGS